jgi:hypothetical protein
MRDHATEGTGIILGPDDLDLESLRRAHRRRFRGARARVWRLSLAQ